MSALWISMAKRNRKSIQDRLFDSISIQEGDLEMVKFCLKNGGKINAKDRIGRSPLYIAAKHGHVEIVKFLVQYGANIHAKCNSGRSVLYIAAYSGRVEIVEFLHQYGADINTKHNNGWSPLHCTAYHGHLEVLKYLVQNGAWLNSKDDKNKTPLDYAIAYSKDDIVEYLKEVGAEENAETKANSTPSSSNINIMTGDYYSILGIKKGSLFTKNLKCKMKETYHKLALEYHPDKNNSEDAMEKFKRIKTAYEVLSDLQKKQIYDKFGEEGLKRKNFNK